MVFMHAGFKFLEKEKLKEELLPLIPNEKCEVKDHFRFEPYFACVHAITAAYRRDFDDTEVKRFYFKWQKKGIVEGVVKYFYCSKKILVAVIYVGGTPFWVTLARGNNVPLQQCKMMANKGVLGDKIECNIKLNLECYKEDTKEVKPYVVDNHYCSCFEI